MADESETLSVPSLPDLVYARLREDIARGVLKPGRLRLADLTERFGVSAIPVREALRRLEAQGLVSFQGNRSIVINALRTEDVVEIFTIRIELECLALRLGFERLAKDTVALADMGRLIAEMDEALDDPNAWRSANEKFHNRLYHPANSPRLESLISNLWVSVEPYMRLYATSADGLRVAQEQHREFVELARKGETKKAEALLREHLKLTQDVVVERLGQAADAAGADGGPAGPSAA